MNVHGGTGWRKASRVRQDVLERLRQPIRRSRDAHRAAGDPQRHRRFGSLGEAKPVDHLCQQRADVYRLQRLLFELRVDVGEIPHVGNQAVEPVHVLGEQIEEAGPVQRVLGLRGHLRGGADRRQRVLELVRDVAREPLDLADVLVEPARQLLQRAREVADLVAPVRVVKDARQPAAPLRQVRRLPPQPPDRPDDGGGGQRREQRGRQKGSQHDLEDSQPDVVERLQHAHRRLRDEHRADDGVSALHRHGARQRQRSLLLRRARRGAITAGQRGPHFGRRLGGCDFDRRIAPGDDRYLPGDRLQASTRPSQPRPDAVQRPRPDAAFRAGRIGALRRVGRGTIAFHPDVVGIGDQRCRRHRRCADARHHAARGA